MKIALDYDNTITADPQFWGTFIEMTKLRGHEIKIVTSRHPGSLDHIKGIEVVYCSFKAKRQFYDADIWIDDDPKYIDQDHVLG